MTTRAAQIELVLGSLLDPNTGDLCSGYTAYFYAAGTSTPKNVWTEKEKTNPFTSYALDSAGKALLYGDGIYKIVIKNIESTIVLSLDNVKIRANNFSVLQKTEAYTVTPDDDIIICDGTFTLSFQDVTLFTNPITVKPTSGSTITLDPYASQTIDGSSPFSVTNAIVLYPDVVSSTWRSDFTLITGEDISWTPQGTGMVTRTVQAKHRESVSIKDAGATGEIDQPAAEVELAFSRCMASAITSKKIYVPTGIYTIANDIVYTTGTYGVDNYQGGRTLYGDGFHSVIRQTGAGKHVLWLKAFWHDFDPPTEQVFWLEGMTIRDLTLIGEAGTYDALRLEGVLRSHFENLNLCSARYCQFEAGTMSNAFVNIKAGKNLFDEQTIVGVTPATPTNCLRISVGSLDWSEAFRYGSNTSDYRCCSYEGASSDGVVAEQWHGATGSLIVENNGATGIYFVSACIHNDLKLWLEGNTGVDLYADGNKGNKLNIISADDGTCSILNSSNEEITGYTDTLTIANTCSNISLNNFKYKTALNDSGVATKYHNVTTGALSATGTEVRSEFKVVYQETPASEYTTGGAWTTLSTFYIYRHELMKGLRFSANLKKDGTPTNPAIRLYYDVSNISTQLVASGAAYAWQDMETTWDISGLPSNQTVAIIIQGRVEAGTGNVFNNGLIVYSV